jgi:amino acid adenylation domain-containing protein
MVPPSNLSHYAAPNGKSSGLAAIVAEGRIWSYGELLQARDRVARRLKDMDVNTPGTAIGVLVRRSANIYASILAVMHSECVYVPLNPKDPVRRLADIADRSGIECLIVDRAALHIAQAVVTRLPGLLVIDVTNDGPPRPILPGEHRRRIRQTDTEQQRHDAQQEHRAYVLFTSGSTGRPKGVPISHKSAVTCIEATSQIVPIELTDRVAQFSEQTFDVSIGEMFLCWRNGACLCAPTPLDLASPLAFSRRSGVTIWSSVPTLVAYLKKLQLIEPDSLPSLRVTLFCGEALPRALALQWSQVSKSSRTINFYGPTEATIFATHHTFDPDYDNESLLVPIGVGLSGFTCRVNGRNDRGSGELLLSGPQVFGGYLNDPVSTAHAFHDDPVSGCRFYRTGDVVRDRGDGTLMFEGREDDQVKIRGRRVQVSEVEISLRDALDSDLVAVMPRIDHDSLVIGLTLFCEIPKLGVADLKALCADRLPIYMIPDRVVCLGGLPRTASGKIDRAELKRMAAEARS